MTTGCDTIQYHLSLCCLYLQFCLVQIIPLARWATTVPSVRVRKAIAGFLGRCQCGDRNRVFSTVYYRWVYQKKNGPCWNTPRRLIFITKNRISFMVIWLIFPMGNPLRLGKLFWAYVFISRGVLRQIQVYEQLRCAFWSVRFPSWWHNLRWCDSEAPWKTGWWFGTWILFSHILGIIIPTDFHIFPRGWNHQPENDTLGCQLKIRGLCPMPAALHGRRQAESRRRQLQRCHQCCRERPGPLSDAKQKKWVINRMYIYNHIYIIIYI